MGSCVQSRGEHVKVVGARQVLSISRPDIGPKHDDGFCFTEIRVVWNSQFELIREARGKSRRGRDEEATAEP